MNVLVIDVPGLRTRNQLNTRKHWQVDRREREQVKEAVTYALLRMSVSRWSKPTEAAPWDVKLVRLGPREMDDDGVVSALKSVRDAFAAHVGIDDKHRHIVRYAYEQEKSKTFGVRIEVRPREAKGAA